MGVIKAWSEVVKEFGYDGVSIEPAGIKVGVNHTSFGTLNYVALDLLATHRAYIISTHHNIMRRQFEAINKAERKAHRHGLPYTRPSPAQMEAEQITQLSRTLVKNIEDTFDKGINVHIDGQPSDQKALVHEERSVQRDKNLHKLYALMDDIADLLGPYGLEIPGLDSLQTLLTKVQSEADAAPADVDFDAELVDDSIDEEENDLDSDGEDEEEEFVYKPTVPVFNRWDAIAPNPPRRRTGPLQPWHIRAFRRSTKEKVVKLLKKLNGLWKNCHPVDAPLKALIATAFQNAGFNVCQCNGEADVCIGTLVGRVGVFTSDSDHMFHGPVVVFRKDLKNPRSFTAYVINDILKSAKLARPAWTVLAIVTKNDYAKNAFHYGFKRNLKTLRKLPGANNSRPNPSTLLDLYIREVNKTKVIKNRVERSRYQRAIEIFIHHTETFHNVGASPTIPVHDDVAILFNVVSYYLYLYNSPTMRTLPEEDINDHRYGRLTIPSAAAKWHPPKGRSTRTLKPDPAPSTTTTAAAPIAQGDVSALSSWIREPFEMVNFNDHRYGWITNHGAITAWRNQQRYLYRTNPSLCALDIAAVIVPGRAVQMPSSITASAPSTGVLSPTIWLLDREEPSDLNDLRYGCVTNYALMSTWRNAQRFLRRTNPSLCALDVHTAVAFSPFPHPTGPAPSATVTAPGAAPPPALNVEQEQQNRMMDLVNALRYGGYTHISPPITTAAIVTPFRERPGWRPHHSLMSSNKYPITVYTIPPDAGARTGTPSVSFLSKRRRQQQVRDRKKNKKKTDEEKAQDQLKAKEKNIKKPWMTKAARAKALRDQDDNQPEEEKKKVKRRFQPTTLLSNKLTRQYATVSLDYGTVWARLRDTVCATVTDPIAQNAIINDIESVIYELVRIATEAWRSASLAIFRYICKVMNSTRGSFDVQIKRRFDRLRHIGNDKDSWYGKVLSAFYNLDSTSAEQQQMQDSVEDYHEIVRDHIALYRRAGRKHPVLNNNITKGLAHFLREVGGDMEKAVHQHQMGNLGTLVERVQSINPTWAVGAGRHVIADIKSGVSKKYGNTAAFCLLNAQLPPKKRMKLFPETQFTDRFVNITESSLLMALKYYKEVSPHTVQYLSLDTFTSTTGANRCVQHSGDVYHQLFVSKNVGYSTSVALLNPDPTTNNNTSFPKQSYFGDDHDNKDSVYNTTRDKLITTLTRAANERGAWDEYETARDNFLSAVEPFFKDAAENKASLDRDKTGDLRRRTYTLMGSICTNGHQLYLHAYHITAKAPGHRQQPKTTKGLLGDIRETLTEGDLLDVYKDNHKYRLLTMDPGIKETVTGTVFDSRFPHHIKNVSISQGSQLDPERKWRWNLKRAKALPKHGDIPEMERSILPLDFPLADLSVESDEDVWSVVEASAEARILSIVRVARPLRRFYGSFQYKKNLRFLKLAQKATLNKAIDRLLSQLGCKGKWVPGSNCPRPLIVAGDGQFGSSSGGPTRHMQFFRRMKIRGEALGYLMVSASEFMTSQICCQCRSDQMLFELRSVQCGGCNQQRDRDRNGAHNIGRAALSWIKNQEWPEELERQSHSSHNSTP